jgi:hypothetical protein
MNGDQQESVEDAPPVRFGQIFARRVRECRQGGHELGREVVCIQVERRGDGRDCLPESGGPSEPDERGGDGHAVQISGITARLTKTAANALDATFGTTLFTSGLDD